MARGIHVEVFIRRKDERDIASALLDKIVRKIVALLGRLGCTAHGEWRLGEPDDVEDLLG
jgi:hypothetical protein